MYELSMVNQGRQDMYELSMTQLDDVYGGAGEMSKETKTVLVAVTFISPIAGAAFLIGYYSNRL